MGSWKDDKEGENEIIVISQIKERGKRLSVTFRGEKVVMRLIVFPELYKYSIEKQDTNPGELSLGPMFSTKYATRNIKKRVIIITP